MIAGCKKELDDIRHEGRIPMPFTKHQVLAEVAHEYLHANPDRVMSDVTFGELSLWLLERATIEEHKSQNLANDAEAFAKEHAAKCDQNNEP